MPVVSGALALGGAALALGGAAAGALAGASPLIIAGAQTFLNSPVGELTTEYVGAEKAAQLARDQAEGKNIEAELNRVYQSAEAEKGRGFTEKMQEGITTM